MDITIILAILGGVFIGLALAYIRIRAGLTYKEWYFLQEFYESLRLGEYEMEDPKDERSGINERH